MCLIGKQFSQVGVTILALGIAATAFASDQRREDHEGTLKHMLKSRGESAESAEDLEAALHSRSYPVRYTALRLFSQRRGKNFVPTLREYLQDEHVRVRCTAAGLLAEFGDNSGLEPMRADYQSLLLPGSSPEDPGDPTKMNLAKLADALEIGRVLAELGDDRALPLALKVAQHELLAVRSDAVLVLGRIVRDGEARQEGSLALDSLVRLAEAEPERTVHGAIAAVALRMEPRSAIKLFDAVVRNPHIPEWLRKVTLEDKAKKEQELRLGSVGSPATTAQSAKASQAPISSQPVGDEVAAALSQSTRPSDAANDDWENVELLWISPPPRRQTHLPLGNTLKDFAAHDPAVAERIRRAVLDAIELNEPERSMFLRQWGASVNDMKRASVFSFSSNSLRNRFLLHGDDEGLLTADLQEISSSVKLAAELFHRWPPLSQEDAATVAAQWEGLLAAFKAAALENGYPETEVEAVIREAKKHLEMTVNQGAFGPFRLKPLSTKELVKLREDMRRLLRSRATQPATESSLARGRRVESQVFDVYQILSASSLVGSPADYSPITESTTPLKKDPTLAKLVKQRDDARAAQRKLEKDRKRKLEEKQKDK